MKHVIPALLSVAALASAMPLLAASERIIDFGDVAVRLMLQRLSYGPKHPPAEVYLDLPKPKPLKKGTER